MAQTAGGTVQTGKKSEAIPNISNTVGTEQEYKRQKSERHPMDLPAHLAERCRWLSEGKKPLGEGPVVVWLKSSFRTHEHPAVDVGKWIAHHQKRELLIYHGLDERYPHASLRHHNMILDAAVDMHRGFEQQGIRYSFHLARKGHRPAVMADFANQASMIITDLFPLPPWTDWVRSVAEKARCPVVEVDCHCVIPMPLYGRSVDRPFKFRDGTRRLRKQRVQRSWPILDLTPEAYTGELPFAEISVEPQLTNPAERWNLLKECEIDPTVHPLWRVRGGEIAALERWGAFREKGLSGYARRRNNAADQNGVSRLSAFIHYGMISTMKIARECAEVGTKSADKYLDELLVFREHAWHHIASSSDPYGKHNLPEWARISWQSTLDDPRTTTYTFRELERGKVHDPLWAACQFSLLRHGELHNNVRMTWGKSIALWTPDVETSMDYGQALNDKYALDGRDPSSVVGVQWCHGLFDRPFHPPAHILGLVRQRDSRTHMSRLDMDGFTRITKAPAAETEEALIVIGAGLAGAVAARILKDYGFDVLVLDKGRRVGGRYSQRRLDEVVVTHGALKLDAWPMFLDAWKQDALLKGHIKTEGDNMYLRDGPAYIAELLDGIEVLNEVTVTGLEREGRLWSVRDDDGFVWKASGVIITAPLPQLHAVVERAPRSWEEHAYASTWSVIITGSKSVPTVLKRRIEELKFHAEFGDDARGLVVHLPESWSKEHLELERSDVVESLMAMIGTDNEAINAWVKASSFHAHRWRYARAAARGERAKLPLLVEAGDAWADPVGTAGAALHSAAWAAADLAWQCSHALKPSKRRVQQTLM